MKKSPPVAALAGARAALRKQANPKKIAISKNFFKDTTNDVFIGVSTPKMRVVAKQYWTLPLPAVRSLMASKVHEERSLAHAILGIKFRKGDEKDRAKIFALYIKNRRHIRQWDGVDDSAPYIVGVYLMDRSKALLYRLVKSKSLWDRRIALVSTWTMIRKGHIADTLKLAKAVLSDGEDLMHKAAGWMLREVGKKDLGALKKFLKRNLPKMPRTMLRYAIERFPEAERLRYLKTKVKR